MLWCSCAHVIAQPSHHCIAIWKEKKITQWVLYTHLNCFFVVVVVVVCATLSLSTVSERWRESGSFSCVRDVVLYHCVCVCMLCAHIWRRSASHIFRPRLKDRHSQIISQQSRDESHLNRTVSQLSLRRVSLSLSLSQVLSLLFLLHHPHAMRSSGICCTGTSQSGFFLFLLFFRLNFVFRLIRTGHATHRHPAIAFLLLLKWFDNDKRNTQTKFHFTTQTRQQVENPESCQGFSPLPLTCRLLN